MTLASDLGRPPAGQLSTLHAVKAAVLCCSIVLVALTLAGSDWRYLVLGHLTLVSLLAALIWLLELFHRSSAELQTFTLLFAVFGPMGGIAGLLADQKELRADRRELEQWYDVIAPRSAAAVTLVDRIRDGRLVRGEAALPRPYQALLTNGSMEEKQALLAYLAASEEPAVVHAALSQALKSPDHRLRVQAAAVAAHTRQRQRQNARTSRNASGRS
ncbi:hypothetical protein ACFSX5_13755 [Devosia albogilva]|uniref:HEAT repeat domain-containing protein n=1 Tax=Devosia albogilva TaxID=429726 RepID=A0ABW5QM98_9HYPH